MAQIAPRFCPRCGAPRVLGQHICAKCGFNMAEKLSGDSYEASGRQPTPRPAWMDWQPALPPKRRSIGRRGFVLILLLVLIVLGIASYSAVTLLGGLPSGGSNSNTAPQSPITTLPVNLTVTYAGVDITVLTAQQSQSFNDDPNRSTTGMVRLNLQEQNKTSIQVSWLYYDIARLILPKGTVVSPSYAKAKVGIDPGTTQTSFVDFAVPTTVKISQLTLRLGADNEAQMAIPLTGQADLSKYQPNTTNLDAPMLYMGLNWTLVSATVQLSIDGQQASKGMRYIVVTLKVDNTLSQTAIPGSAYDYVRLKSGPAIASPKATTLPVSFEMGETGKTGTVTFLIPQDSTSFTLILLSQSQSGADQAFTDFQLA